MASSLHNAHNEESFLLKWCWKVVRPLWMGWCGACECGLVPGRASCHKDRWPLFCLLSLHGHAYSCAFLHELTDSQASARSQGGDRFNIHVRCSVWAMKGQLRLHSHTHTASVSVCTSVFPVCIVSVCACNSTMSSSKWLLAIYSGNSTLKKRWCSLHLRSGRDKIQTNFKPIDSKHLTWKYQMQELRVVRFWPRSILLLDTDISDHVFSSWINDGDKHRKLVAKFLHWFINYKPRVK